MMDMEKRSLRESGDLTAPGIWRMSSGAMYPGLPMMPVCLPSGATLSLSQTSTSPVSGRMKKFPSFRS